MWKPLKVSLLAGAGALAAWKAADLLAQRRKSISFRQRNVLITGGSRGLGLVMARQLASEGARLAICARDENELRRAATELRASGATVVTHACDLTQPDQIAELLDHVRQELGPIDVLINNAGIIQVGPVSTMTEKDIEQALALHLWAPYHTINAVLPEMRAQGGGRIVNIASIGGEISVPHLLPYCISKFALVGYSRGIAYDLAKENIHVTTICPGLMRTGSHVKAQFKGRHRAEFSWFSVSSSMPLASMNAERAAQQILAACRAGKSHVTLSLPAKLVVGLNAIAPEFMSELFRMASSLLPQAEASQTEKHEGIDSTSVWSPSWMTMLGDQAAARNNELGNRSLVVWTRTWSTYLLQLYSHFVAGATPVIASDTDEVEACDHSVSFTDNPF